MQRSLLFFVVRTKHIILHMLTTGDFIIVINCRKSCISPATNWKKKIMITFTGYPGGLKEETAKNLLKRRPEVLLKEL